MANVAANLPPERPGHQALPDLVERRRGLAAAAEAGAWRTDPPAEETTIAGIRVLRYDPPGPPSGVVLHFHGGAYRLGAPEIVGHFASALSKLCGVTVICPAYRLAPEHPFPAALSDAWAVFIALRASGAHPLIVSGDSAGGGLAASLTLFAAAHRAAPACLVLLSAWLDLTLESDCYEKNAATDPLFSRASAEDAAKLYLQGASPEDPLVSPVFGSLADFPPTFVNFGLEEVLADDSRRFHAALEAAGAPVHLDGIAGMEHVAVTRGLELPGAPETLAAVGAFIDKNGTRAGR